MYESDSPFQLHFRHFLAIQRSLLGDNGCISHPPGNRASLTGPRPNNIKVMGEFELHRGTREAGPESLSPSYRQDGRVKHQIFPHYRSYCEGIAKLHVAHPPIALTPSSRYPRLFLQIHLPPLPRLHCPITLRINQTLPTALQLCLLLFFFMNSSLSCWLSMLPIHHHGYLSADTSGHLAHIFNRLNSLCHITRTINMHIAYNYFRIGWTCNGLEFVKQITL